jgi:hypothetical protein
MSASDTSHTSSFCLSVRPQLGERPKTHYD